MFHCLCDMLIFRTPDGEIPAFYTVVRMREQNRTEEVMVCPKLCGDMT
jgi:hypothetical protein